MWQNSKTQNSTKLKKNMTKHKLKIWQSSKTWNVKKFKKNLNVTKLKNSKFERKNLNNQIVAKLKKTLNMTNSKTKIFI